MGQIESVALSSEVNAILCQGTVWSATELCNVNASRMDHIVYRIHPLFIAGLG